MCREVVAILRRLKEQRDMSLNEVRLTVAIEDPRARERRLMGIEVRRCEAARCVGETRPLRLEFAACLHVPLRAVAMFSAAARRHT
jgi:hypothetical protein